jgi:hypothetical protein
MIGTLPVIHTVGETFRHAVPIVPLYIVVVEVVGVVVALGGVR